MPTPHPDWLIEQMALELRTDLQEVARRIQRCSIDPEVRARLAVASASYMFGIAVAAQHDATPMDKMAIAGWLTNELLGMLEADHPGPGFSGMNAG